MAPRLDHAVTTLQGRTVEARRLATRREQHVNRPRTAVGGASGGKAKHVFCERGRREPAGDLVAENASSAPRVGAPCRAPERLARAAGPRTRSGTARGLFASSIVGDRANRAVRRPGIGPLEFALCSAPTRRCPIVKPSSSVEGDIKHTGGAPARLGLANRRSLPWGRGGTRADPEPRAHGPTASRKLFGAPSRRRRTYLVRLSTNRSPRS